MHRGRIRRKPQGRENREFAFIVRRRADDSAEERARITGPLSDVQPRLASLEARVRVEAPRVGVAYSRLVAATRAVAGSLIRSGWDSRPLPTDRTGRIEDVDFTPLVAERNRIEAEMEALGESDLPEAVIRGRARKLARELRRIEEELSAAEAPRGSWATLYADALSDTRSTAAYLDDPSTRAWLETLLTDIRVGPAKPGADVRGRVSVKWRPEAVEIPAGSAS